jgi:hypothetical protein
MITFYLLTCFILENLEFGARICSIPFEEFRLRDKESGTEFSFNKYKEVELSSIRNNIDVS